MFVLGQKSEQNLVGVKLGIVKCARRAIGTTIVDFGVHEGVRTRARQEKLYASGASRKLDSYHLTGHALDLVPYVDGTLLWQMPLCIQVALAMREAALFYGEPIVWGAIWDRLLEELDPSDLAGEIRAYVKRYHLSHPARLIDGKWVQPEPLIDGAHFQTRR